MVKEELVFQRMLGLRVLVRERWGEGVIPERVATPGEVDTAQKPKTGLLVDPKSPLVTKHKLEHPPSPQVTLDRCAQQRNDKAFFQKALKFQ